MISQYMSLVLNFMYRILHNFYSVILKACGFFPRLGCPCILFYELEIGRHMHSLHVGLLEGSPYSGLCIGVGYGLRYPHTVHGIFDHYFCNMAMYGHIIFSPYIPYTVQPRNVRTQNVPLRVTVRFFLYKTLVTVLPKVKLSIGFFFMPRLLKHTN
jgi:hypothetical protein